MKDLKKTKAQLVAELDSLRARIRELEASVGLDVNDSVDHAGKDFSSDHRDTIKAFDWEYQHHERIKELHGIIGLGRACWRH